MLRRIESFSARLDSQQHLALHDERAEFQEDTLGEEVQQTRSPIGPPAFGRN